MIYRIAALYQFQPIEDPEALRLLLLDSCRKLQLLGTLLVAKEGINGTVAGASTSVTQLRHYLERELGYKGLQWKEADSDQQPFLKLKVKVKAEIVTMGIANIEPAGQVGTYVKPEEWNDLISDPEVTVIDTRNRYEVHLGTFAGATDPQTDSFRDFPEYVQQKLDPERHRKVAMFCTGGIRCEKATAYLKQQGFSQVFHLEGGILKYLEEVPTEDSLWQGECFVFDDRVTVDHDLNPSAREVCPNCRMPISEGDKEQPEFERNVSCKHCFDRVSSQRRESLLERAKQRVLSEARERAKSK